MRTRTHVLSLSGRLQRLKFLRSIHIKFEVFRCLYNVRAHGPNLVVACATSLMTIYTNQTKATNNVLLFRHRRR